MRIRIIYLVLRPYKGVRTTKYSFSKISRDEYSPSSIKSVDLGPIYRSKVIKLH